MFEKWLRRRCKVVEADLKYKHKRMRKNAFVFRRATYFRWAKGIETICPELKNAPRVHFGTWRDAQGRLVWGVNDFDEAAIIPYAFDLVRLAASVSLAPKMRIGRKRAAAAILAGYRLGLRAPRPTLLDEHQNSQMGGADGFRGVAAGQRSRCPQELLTPVANVRSRLRSGTAGLARAGCGRHRTPRSGTGRRGRCCSTSPRAPHRPRLKLPAISEDPSQCVP